MVGDTALLQQSIASTARSLRRREISCVELVELTLRHIADSNEALNSFITVSGEQAIAAAKLVDDHRQSGHELGLLAGIPIGHKDVIRTRNLPTTAHSNAIENVQSSEDATVVEKLDGAGAIVVGKLNTYEFACGATESYGVPVNPWDQTRTTGGSSAGSVSAVAAGMCFGASGTDTGGSIRGPAAYCGVVGLKPTYGLVSRTGVYPLSWSLDHVGPIARTAEDAAILLDAMIGPDKRDPSSTAMPDAGRQRLARLATGNVDGSNLTGVRIGVPETWLHEGVQSAVTAAAESALAVLKDLGCTLVPVSLPLAKASMSAMTGIISAEAAVIHGQRLRERVEKYARFTRQTLLLGTCIDAETYLKAQSLRFALVNEVNNVLDRVDVLLWPTTRQVAPSVYKAETWGVIQTQLTDLTGHPSISVPCGFDQEGLPIGIHITGRHLEDDQVLRIGMAYQAATNWESVRPEFDASFHPVSSKQYSLARFPEGVGSPEARALEQWVVQRLTDCGIRVLNDDVPGLAASLWALREGLSAVPARIYEQFEPLVHRHVAVAPM